MYEIYFRARNLQTNKFEDKCIGTTSDEKSIWKIIKEHMKEVELPLPKYTRGWMEEDRSMYDIGSWSKFYYHKEV